MKKDSFNMELNLEHINPELIDIPVFVEIEVYKGRECRENDDPDELTINKITIMEEVKYVENGVKYTLYKDDEIKIIDDEIEEQVYEKYESNQ